MMTKSTQQTQSVEGRTNILHVFTQVHMQSLLLAKHISDIIKFPLHSVLNRVSHQYLEVCMVGYFDRPNHIHI